jgi:hypothetical protein
VLIPFALYLGPNTSLSAVYGQAQVTAFSDTKKMDLAVDQDQKWIVTWNSYLARIRHFYRWLYSQRHREPIPQEEWETPHVVKIRDKKTKRQSPYDVAQIWDLHEMLRILPTLRTSQTRQPSLFSGTSMLETTKLRSWPFTMSGCGRTMGKAKWLKKDTNSSLFKVGLFF